MASVDPPLLQLRSRRQCASLADRRATHRGIGRECLFDLACGPYIRPMRFIMGEDPNCKIRAQPSHECFARQPRRGEGDRTSIDTALSFSIGYGWRYSGHPSWALGLHNLPSATIQDASGNGSRTLGGKVGLRGFVIPVETVGSPVEIGRIRTGFRPLARLSAQV